MTIDPQTVSASDIYKVMTGIIVPRPIAFVSTVDREGVRNLAPFSFFTGVSADPPVVCFAPVRNLRGVVKDTRNNIEATGEFVISVVSEDLAERMNLTAPEFDPGVDEFAVAGLTPVTSDLVKAPRVKESPAAMECRLLQIIDFSQKPLGGCLIIGEIVRFHIDDNCIDNFRVDPDVLRAIGRMAGNAYARTRDRFDMVRPTVTSVSRSPGL